MTANQRRPGFRLPWSSESDADGAAPAAANPEWHGEATAAPAAAETPQGSWPEAGPEATTGVTAPAGDASEGASDAADAAARVTDASPGTATSPAEPSPAVRDAAASDDFMRELVAAMRTVADEARQQGLSQLRARAEEQVRRLDADAERRREELRQRADADVAGVGEWARAEAERIKAEAEQRVVARRAQLEQQLAGEAARTESEARAVRERVAEYERELEAFHAQLAGINDPAAFAAAAKRMPRPPTLGGEVGTVPAAGAPSTTVDAGERAQQAPVEPATGPSNGVGSATTDVHPAEEEVLAARLAELDASLPEGDSATAVVSEPVTTEIVVKGLGSFGAITGFRQSLAGVDGVDGVALSLGQTGEFVFRATHRAGFDIPEAIISLEGEGAKVEERPEGGYRVTLDRSR